MNKVEKVEEATIWNFARKVNVPYGKLFDFINENRIRSDEK